MSTFCSNYSSTSLWHSVNIFPENVNTKVIPCLLQLKPKAFLWMYNRSVQFIFQLVLNLLDGVEVRTLRGPVHHFPCSSRFLPSQVVPAIVRRMFRVIVMVKINPGPIRWLPDGTPCLTKMLWYTSYPGVHKSPVPEAEITPHTIKPSPLCLTVGKWHSFLYLSHQTNTLRLLPNGWTLWLISPQHFIPIFLCPFLVFFSNFRHFTIFFSFSNGFFAAVLPTSPPPPSFRCGSRHTVLVWSFFSP